MAFAFATVQRVNAVECERGKCMKCGKCGFDNVKDSNFCIQCGAPLKKKEKLSEERKVQMQAAATDGVHRVQEKLKGYSKTVGEVMSEQVEKASGSSFYIVDFFESVARKSNVPVIGYLMLNVLIIGAIMTVFLSCNYFVGLLAGIVAYAISLVIALSPVGEWIIRLQTGCKKITDTEILNYIEPIFGDVYQKAKAKDPKIPDNVQLYMNDDETPNAFATGRSTVCITKGMLEMPEEQIRATLGHEFGHLAHKDTDLILVVAVGNMIISGVILGIRVLIELVYLFMQLFSFIAKVIFVFGGDSFNGLVGLMSDFAAAGYRFLLNALVAGLTWAWTKIGVLLVMKSNRDKEYEADEFSCTLGYGNALCALLEAIDENSAKGLFASLASSHPDKESRIAKIREFESTK